MNWLTDRIAIVLFVQIIRYWRWRTRYGGSRIRASKARYN
jgi:hypothetical protein